jgi:hypothetical protein
MPRSWPRSSTTCPIWFPWRPIADDSSQADPCPTASRR